LEVSDHDSSVLVSPRDSRAISDPERHLTSICSADCGAVDVRLFGLTSRGLETCLMTGSGTDEKGFRGNRPRIFALSCATALTVARGHIVVTSSVVGEQQAGAGAFNPLTGVMYVLVGVVIVGDLLVTVTPKGIHIDSLLIDF
jgi:hypothetical protein